MSATDELAEFSLDPVVDDSTAGETAYKRENGTRVTVGEVAAAQARLLDLIAKHARGCLKSGNPGRRGAGRELLELMGLDR